MKYSVKDHTFVVCAYKESAYLEQCVQSLLDQTVKSSIIISTSTPNEHISSVAEKYDIPVYVNDGRKSIADDWNYGCSKVVTSLYTIAHQDDIYKPEYLEIVLDQLNTSVAPLIAFTDYEELREEGVCESNKLLKIKRFMLKPLTVKKFQKSRWIRRRVLSMGNAICCPSVTFVKERLPKQVFTYGYRSNVDWQAWERISRLNGSFVYVNKPLMYHRIHEESETSKVLGDHARVQEDYELFCRFWPKMIARILSRVYSSSEKSNG